MTVSAQLRAELERLVGGAHHDPHSLLGAHPTGDGRTVIRTLRPDATERRARRRQEPRADGPASTTAACSRRSSTGRRRTTGSRSPTATDHYVVDDPYRWLPTLGEVDLHLIGEGRHENLWEVLGAHVRTYDTPGGTVTGTSFAVWAPNARGVRVTGDFDFWSGARAADALARLVRRLGAVRARRRRRRAVQVPGARRRQPVARQGRPDGVRDRGAAGDRVGRAHRPATSGPTRDWLEPRAPDQLGRRARCRSTRCTSARGGWGCPTASWPSELVEYVTRHRVHPRRVPAGRRASRSAARGVTRSRRTTRRPRASATRTTSATSSTRCTRPASA